MKYNFTVIVALLISGILSAQNFQGKATYKSQRKVNIKLDSTQMESEMHKKMMQQLKKQFEKTYILTFNKSESIYKEDEKLGAPQRPNGMEMVIVNTGGSDILYKNTKEDRYTNQNDVFGKVFLIKDSLQKLDWKLEGETKNIGEYTCYKATLKREIEIFESGMSVNGDKDLSELQNAKPKTKEITITAWYTPKISVNNGPGNYYGLPGLILEVNDGSETVVCSKIVMNPKNKIALDEPTKGKVVTQDKFEEIMDKKMKEMNERRRSNRSDDGGQEVEIIIGG